MTRTTNATAKTRATTKAPATKATRKYKASAVKPAKVDPDLIRSSQGTANGENHAVTSHGNETLVFPTNLWHGDVRAAAAPGQSFTALKALVATKKATAMAKGVNARTAPQSAKAFADAKPAKATAPAAKPAKPAKAKPATERSAKRDCKVTLLVKPEDSGVKGGRLAKLKLMWKVKPATVADILGRTVVDDGGKEHTMDMGAINGMLRRQHISIA